jgi:Ca-activated chloride channel family protein
MRFLIHFLKSLLKFVFTSVALAFTLGAVGAGQRAEAGELRGVLKNNEGVRKFGSKNSAQAFEDFTGALSDLPFSGEVHFNIGNSFLIRREYEKALSEYGQAEKNAAGDSRRERETRFRALFNKAVALTELKKTDEALEAYQKALGIYPESVETKTNIELLTAGGGGSGGDDDKDDKKDKDDKGKGKPKDDKDKKDDKDGKEKKKEEPKEVVNPRSTPKPFKSEELSQQDVKRILEELKRQEAQIRAKMQNEQRKDAPPEKDW